MNFKDLHARSIFQPLAMPLWLLAYKLSISTLGLKQSKTAVFKSTHITTGNGVAVSHTIHPLALFRFRSPNCQPLQGFLFCKKCKVIYLLPYLYYIYSITRNSLFVKAFFDIFVNIFIFFRYLYILISLLIKLDKCI